MKRAIAIIALTVSSALAGNRTPEIVVALVPLRSEISAGDRPVFIVAIRATGSTVRIFDFAEREDLLRHYVKIVIKNDGDTVEVPSAISDPGPASEDDLVDLKPGEKLAFEYDGYPDNLRHLPVGIYSASVWVESDPESRPVQSNVVSLRVKPGEDS